MTPDFETHSAAFGFFAFCKKEETVGGCGGLKENVSQRPSCLDIGSLIGGAVWEFMELSASDSVALG